MSDLPPDRTASRGASASPGHQSPRRTRALSCHATYACGNSGACCSAGWPIPVEGHILPVLQDAIDSRRVTTAGAGPELTFPAERPASIGAVLGRTTKGTCVFFDRTQLHGCCRVHRQAGVAAMPIACRQFPRLARHDARGTDVSLSHWCPTALASLAADMPLTIVEGPAAFASGEALEGLDARDDWPPLLRPDCLWDLDAFGSFESHAVELLGNSKQPLRARLSTFVSWSEQLRGWTPAQGSLEDMVVRTAAATSSAHARTPGDRGEADARLWRALVEAVPGEWRTRVPARMHNDCNDDALLDEPAARDRVGRYLAARFFGSWMAYQGTGLRALVASIAMAFTAVRRGLAVAADAPSDVRLDEAIRSADFMLVHLATPEVLAEQCNRWEA